jgi:hypothetical protein
MVLSGGRKKATWRSKDPHFVLPLHMIEATPSDTDDDEIVLNLRVSLRAIIVIGVFLHIIVVPGSIFLDWLLHWNLFV